MSLKPCSHRTCAAVSVLILRTGFAVFQWGTFRQADAYVDAGKLMSDQFQASTLSMTLGVAKP